MKKGFKLFAIMASAIFALTACTSDKLEAVSGQPGNNPDNPENAVSFGTYMGKTGTTRAGAYGAINNALTLSNKGGFGIFAYSTGTQTYDQYRTQNAEGTKRYPNFMYNQKVTYQDDKWTYSPVKYWPNEITNASNKPVDDQNNDSANDPATTDYTNGGNVSFFAYAPYANATVTASTGIASQATTGEEGTDGGIVAFSGNGFNGGKADASAANEKHKFSDPYVKYQISSDSKKQVDLLWGTVHAEGSDENVLNESKQEGKAADTYNDYYDVSGTQTAYESDVRPGFKVNADLTKQKTTGKVNFLFKHALAKIGGSYVNKSGGDATGYDDDPTTLTNGLMVVLDLDNNDAETGGSLEEYKETTLEAGSSAEDNKYNTKVTINEIKLNSEKQLTAAGKTAIETNNTFSYETMTEDLISAGLFNLVTGVWSDTTHTTHVSRTQTIVPSDGLAESTTTDGTKDAILSKPIAEPATHPAYTKAGFESLPIGVTTVPKNVYKSDVQPFVFIPGSYPIITISIDYTVRTYDKNLKDAYSEVRQKITKRLYILDQIQLNKQYSILMRLGLTSVKFEAWVSGWDTDNNENVTGSTDGVDGSTKINTSDETVEHVYLPINVAELTAVKAIDTDGNEVDLTNLDWYSLFEKTIAFEFEYADGTKRKTNELKDGKPLMPTLDVNVVKKSNTKDEDFEFKKLPDDDNWNGTFQLKWKKNVSTFKKGININFKYGNQTISSQSTQKVGPLKVTVSETAFAAKGTKSTGSDVPEDFITEVKAADGDGDAQAGYTILWTSTPDWATINTTDGKVSLEAYTSNTSNREATFKVKKDDAVSETLSTLNQKGYELKLSVSGTVVAVTDGDDQVVTLSSGFTVTVKDASNNDSSDYTTADNKVTVTATNPGTYTVTVTHTASGATKSETVTVS